MIRNARLTERLECLGQPDLIADVWGYNGGWELGDQIGFKDVVVKNVYCCEAFKGCQDSGLQRELTIFGWEDLDGLNMPGGMFVAVTNHGAKCSK